MSDAWHEDTLRCIGVEELYYVPSRPALAHLWTERHQDAACNEDWGLWCTDPEWVFAQPLRLPFALQIEKLDSTGTFENDAQAIAHVAVMAVFGASPLHGLALKLHAEYAEDVAEALRLFKEKEKGSAPNRFAVW